MGRTTKKRDEMVRRWERESAFWLRAIGREPPPFDAWLRSVAQRWVYPAEWRKDARRILRFWKPDAR